MIALGYVRRSKESVTGRTVSLEEQRARVAAYATEHGWTLIVLPPDDGVSGGRRERLERIEVAVRQHGAGAVIVYHLDRFARDVAALLDTLRAWSRRGVELHVVGRGRVETRSASGYLLTAVEGAMAEHYRLLVGEKTRDALAHLRAAGRRFSGRPPFGWHFLPTGQVRVDQDGRAIPVYRLEPDPAEQAILARIRRLRAAGLSLRAISRALARRGILARNRRPFAARTLARLVTDRGVGHSRTAA